MLSFELSYQLSVLSYQLSVETPHRGVSSYSVDHWSFVSWILDISLWWSEYPIIKEEVISTWMFIIQVATQKAWFWQCQGNSRKSNQKPNHKFQKLNARIYSEFVSVI